jgi:hypothetical protein
MALTATLTSSNNVGVLTYNWSLTQTSGTTLAGLTFTNGTNSSVLTYPATITYAGASATSGTYSFNWQCQVTDSGVSSCVQVRNKVLYFLDTPPTCTLTLSAITIS